MKKLVVISTLLVSWLLLSSCSPFASGVAVVAQDVTTATSDRRSPGELIDDKNIFKKLNKIVKNDSMLENSHISFLVYDKSAAMLGEAPTDEAVDYLEKQIKKNKSAKMRVIFILNFFNTSDKRALNEKISSIIDFASFLVTFILMLPVCFRRCCCGTRCNHSDI